MRYLNAILFLNHATLFHGRFSYYKNILILILAIPCVVPVAAQRPSPSAEWMLKELLRDSTLDASILQWNRVIPEKHMFWPEDLKNNVRPYILQDNIVKNKHGFFMLIPGTGRVYRMQLSDDHVQFIRIDSTTYFGHNFSALNFSSQDTLFSLGGHGFWQSNGLLRYYDRWISGWELIPLNQRVEGGFYDHSFHDKQHHIYYVVGPKIMNHANNGLKKSVPRPQENPFSLYALDLIRKDWVRIGIVTADKEPLSRIGDLPWVI